ncbi:SUKH-3 domain-containing protein [Cryptosporangium arvum]|uniref:SUKH-3 domain-containing protein n=1 Tax=Cryptosporangium arvum TaxID=80871 RepID=UPI0004BA84D7|nr:SUKH-3 domain-containing protein [Cryptosporangium arvum]
MQRFPSEVETVLREAGWNDGRHVPDVAAETIRAVIGRTAANGARHLAFPAAEQALLEFGALYVDQDGPGVALRRRPFAIDPAMVPPCAATLQAFGRALGVSLFPLGVEGDDDAVLAIDEYGRVFSLDDGGEWFLGEDVPAALTTLVTGVQPPRVRDDGAWNTESDDAEPR